MPAVQKTISPVDGRVYVERTLATPDEINEILRIAQHAQRTWRNGKRGGSSGSARITSGLPG